MFDVFRSLLLGVVAVPVVSYDLLLVGLVSFFGHCAVELLLD